MIYNLLCHWKPLTICVSVVCYDRLDRDIRKAVQAFDGKTIHVDNLYNARGEVAKVSDPYFDLDSPLWTVNEYDDLNRVVKQTEPDNSVTQSHHRDYQPFRATHHAGQRCARQ